MSFIELKIPGKEMNFMHDYIDCVLDGKVPSVDEVDTLSIKYNIEFPDFDDFLDKIRSLVKIIENPVVEFKYKFDQEYILKIKECIFLLEFIQKKYQNDFIDEAIARISFLNEEEKKV